jgi:PAS domain S-box-containing protein
LQIIDGIGQAAGRMGISIVVATADADPKILHASANAAELLGYGVDELRTVTPWDLVSPEDLPRLVKGHAKLLAGESPRAIIELHLRHKDGRLIPVSMTSEIAPAGDDRVVVTVLIDLSSQEAVRTALAESESRFRSVVESAPDGVAILRGTRIAYLNPTAAHMFGYANAEDAVGRLITDHLVPDQAATAKVRFDSVLAEGRQSDGPTEYRVRDHCGQESVIELSSIRIDFEGAPAVLGFARDITERRAAQSKLIQADRLAAVGTLAAGVAHEINNPLAYMTLGLERLARALDNAPIPADTRRALLERIHYIRDGADRVATIVRDLKSFSRADDDGFGPVDVRAAIENTIRLTEHEIRHRARLVRDFDDVPPVKGSRARLEQVLLNLLVNAIQALGEGRKEPHEIRISSRHPEPSHVHIEITDTGSGIPSEVLDKIFDPFFTTKAVGVGTGLGLPICQGLVDSLGGQLQIDSTVGTGTRVRVILPVFEAESRPHPSPLSSIPPPSRRGRVLIVDDEPQVLRVLSESVRQEHDVLAATNGRDALALLDADDRIDAIVCDVMMPDLSGVDLHDRLARRKPELARRMVFMTGGAFTRQATEFIERTTLPVLDKPFDPRALRALLRERVDMSFEESGPAS